MTTRLLLLLCAGTSFAAPPEISKQTYVYKVVDGTEIHADVYRIPDGRSRPAILWIHGGALIMGQRGNLNPLQMEKYVGAGFTVVSIDYRLAPEVKLPAILEDVRDAYAWLRAKGPGLFAIDPNRIAVVGGSAGGYLTLMCGDMLRPRPKALVAFYGYGDIDGPWYGKPDPFYLRSPAVSREEAYAAVGGKVLTGAGSPNNRGRFYLYCRQHGIWPQEVAGLDPVTQPRAFDRYCPIRNITRDYPPTMLLHGDADTDVPYQQSVAMDAELARRGVEHQFITIPGGPHGFDGGKRMSDPVVAQAFARALEFLQRHM